MPLQGNHIRIMNTFIRRILPAILTGTLTCGTAQAAIQLAATRVIMNEKDRNVSVFAKNLGTDPVVVQAWIDGHSEEMQTPFFITPPLSRFDGEVERSLTITRVNSDFPTDRESYYWVNILEIPQKAETTGNSLSLAMHTRIKLFYRPAPIKNAAQGPNQLTWKLDRDGKNCSITIANASPYTVNFSRIDIDGESGNLGNGLIAIPLESTRLEISKCPASRSLEAKPHVVNDYGAIEPWPVVRLQEGQAITGETQ